MCPSCWGKDHIKGKSRMLLQNLGLPIHVGIVCPPGNYCSQRISCLPRNFLVLHVWLKFWLTDLVDWWDSFSWPWLCENSIQHITWGSSSSCCHTIPWNDPHYLHIPLCWSEHSSLKYEFLAHGSKNNYCHTNLLCRIYSGNFELHSFRIWPQRVLLPPQSFSKRRLFKYSRLTCWYAVKGKLQMIEQTKPMVNSSG